MTPGGVLRYVDLRAAEPGCIYAGIDVGFSHLGWVVAEVVNGKDLRVTDGAREDLGDFRKTSEAFLLDELVRRFLDATPVIGRCKRVFVEQQPPGGMVAVQWLLRALIGADRVTLVSPTALQKRFGYGNLDYDNRKLWVEAATEQYLSRLSAWAGVTDGRRHDMGDALLILALGLEKEPRCGRPMRSLPGPGIADESECPHGGTEAGAGDAKTFRAEFEHKHPQFARFVCAGVDDDFYRKLLRDWK
ncbi:MAG: hypothetical protein CMA10_04635 [Euryarchaeota archaeon]|nr:hypothetical protein [Euryarchaeota archaeon]|tara:strand:+ start:21125 stop:21862 length:738 start_codon:yes stop_codon:yes gene_type:complete